jgi:hypothetical protein
MVKYKPPYNSFSEFVKETTKEMINIQNTKNEKKLDNYNNYLSYFKNKQNYFKY